MKLTDKQREYLHARIARQIMWRLSQTYEKDNANRLATACIEAIEGAATEASTVKLAVTRLADHLERTG